MKTTDREAIESARSAFNNLTETQQKLVTNTDKLAAVEAALAAAEKAAADEAAASKVEEQIATLPEAEEVKVTDKGAIESARVAFNDLTETQQKLVENIDKLVAVEAALAAAEKAAADEAAASKVEEQIDALPEAEEVKVTDKEAIESARAAFNGLTETQQKLVANIDKLAAVEAALAAAEKSAADEAAASKVEEQIAALPEAKEVKVTDRETIESARSAFNNLTEAQQKLVTNTDKLAAVEAALAAAEKAAADEAAANEVIELIEELPAVGKVKVSHAGQIEAARTAFNALSNDQKLLVINIDKLEAAEAKVDALISVEKAAQTLNLVFADKTNAISKSPVLRIPNDTEKVTYKIRNTQIDKPDYDAKIVKSYDGRQITIERPSNWLFTVTVKGTVTVTVTSKSDSSVKKDIAFNLTIPENGNGPVTFNKIP